MIVINKYMCVLFLLLFSQIIFSQNIDFSNSNFKSDKKGLKIVKSHLKKGDKFRENAIDNLVNFRNTDIDADSAYFYYKIFVFRLNQLFQICLYLLSFLNTYQIF